MTGTALHSGTPAGRPGHVVVVGGGLAGLAAAVRLADNGARVTLLEARPRLGGATYSFRRGGLVVDNGQHVFLRCYTAYQGLLRRLGVLDRTMVQTRFDVPVLSPGRRPARLYRTGLPAPLHLGASLARYPLLHRADRLRVAFAALRLRTLDPADPALDRRRFGPWLRAHGQTERCVRALWEPFTVSALNLPVEDASLGLAAMVFRTGLLTGTDAADIGFPLVPLQALHGDPAAALLRRLGADVRVSAKVTGIRMAAPTEASEHAPPRESTESTESTAPTASAAPGLRVRVDGGEIAADAVVVAVPSHTAGRLLPPGALPDNAAPARLGATPIVNAHVVYDRPVTRLPFAAAVGSPVQWLFDRGPVAGLPPGDGQYLAVSLSAAERYVDTPSAALREEFLPALERLLPAAHDARVSGFFVTRERRATFRQAPGSRGLRPRPTTGVPGLFLAGAWTDTGWPDVMEGAVCSGEEAAHLAVAHLAGIRVGTRVDIRHEQEVTA